MKTMITNVIIAILGALTAAGVKVPNLDAQTVAQVIGAIATIAAVVNQLVHYFRDKPQDPVAAYHRRRGYALPSTLLLLLAAAVIVLLTGCTGLMTPSMSAEQLAAVAKDKNASAVCATGTGPWGKVNTVYVNVDRSSISNGAVTIDTDCKVSVTTAQKPAQ